MNILVLPSWYNSKTNPVLGSFFKEQAQALYHYGHHIIIGYCETVGIRQIVRDDLYRIRKRDEDGILTYRYSIPSYGSDRREKKFERAKTAYKHLIKVILKENKIELIHAHSYRPAGFAACALKDIHQLPVVITEHYGGIMSELPDYYKKSLRLTMQRADALISVSGALRDNMKKVYSEKDIYVIPDMVSPQFNYHSKTKSDVFTIITCGNLIKSKKHDMTIAAFHEAFAKDQNTRLLIIGDGPQRLSLQEQVKSLGENNRIQFTGRLPRKSVADIMKRADVFVLPSESETFGVVYIEAMASGLPVIGTRNGGYDEIYDPTCGYIIDKNNLTQLIKTIQKCHEEVWKFNSAEISNKTIKKYGELSIAEQLTTVFNTTISQY